MNSIGDIYDGEFRLGKKSGIGKLKEKRSEYELNYIGEFRNDKFNGKG